MNEMDAVEFDEIAEVDAEWAVDDMAEAEGERGVTTAEYAIGVVMVISVVVLVIQSLRAGWFEVLVKTLIEAIFQLITSQIGLG